MRLVCRIVNVFTNGSQWCMLASCLFHLRPNCLSRTQIASSYSGLAVIAAHPEELFSASRLSLARPRELPITFWHVTCLPLCQPYCYGGGDLTAAGQPQDWRDGRGADGPRKHPPDKKKTTRARTCK